MGDLMKIIVLCLLMLSIQAFAYQDPSKDVDAAFAILSEGMTEAEKKIMRKQAEEAKKGLKEFYKKSPEEQRKLIEEAKKTSMNQEDYNKRVESMSPEEKANLEKMKANLEKHMKKTK